MSYIKSSTSLPGSSTKVSMVSSLNSVAPKEKTSAFLPSIVSGLCVKWLSSHDCITSGDANPGVPPLTLPILTAHAWHLVLMHTSGYAILTALSSRVPDYDLPNNDVTPALRPHLGMFFL